MITLTAASCQARRARMVSLTKPMLTHASSITKIASAKGHKMQPNLGSRLSSLSSEPASVRNLVLRRLARSAMLLTSTLPAGHTGSSSPSKTSQLSQAPARKVSTIRTIHFSIIRLRHWLGLTCLTLKASSTQSTSTPKHPISVLYSPTTARLVARPSHISTRSTGTFGKVSILYS